jgi:hypothetical protein
VIEYSRSSQSRECRYEHGENLELVVAIDRTWNRYLSFYGAYPPDVIDKRGAGSWSFQIVFTHEDGIWSQGTLLVSIVFSLL